MASKVKHRTATQNRQVAYSHPLRAAILTILTERMASPSGLVRRLELERKDLSLVDYHVKKLVEFECAEVVDERRGRGSLTETFYKAVERALVETDEWTELIESDPALADHYLGEFMQSQLDDYIASWRAGVLGSDPEFHITRTYRPLDAEGVKAMLALREEGRLAADEIQREAEERLSESGGEVIPVSDGIALFKLP